MKILRRHLLMETCSLFIVCFCECPRLRCIQQDSFTLELNILILVVLPMILVFHNLSINLKTALAFPV